MIRHAIIFPTLLYHILPSNAIRLPRLHGQIIVFIITQKIQTNVLILLDFWGWICYTARVATKIAANSVPVSVKETRGRSVPIAL